MGKFGQGVLGYVFFQLLPLVFFVPDFFALGAYGHESFQKPDALVQFPEQGYLNGHNDEKNGQFNKHFTHSLGK